MNSDKAKEYFSAYCEGTLDKGLRQQLESRLQSDPRLRSDLEAFQAMLGSLGALSQEMVAVPADLDEKIQARLDRHIWEKERAKPAPWFGWLRTLALSGLGALAIFGAINGINARSNMSQAGIGPTAVQAPKNQLSAKWDGKSVVLNYQPSGKQTVVVRAADGAELKRVQLDGAAWESDLQNPNAFAAVFSVQLENEAEDAVFVVPGYARTDVADGEGTLLDFCKGVADFYGHPVLVRVKDRMQSVNWSFVKNPSVLNAVTQSLPNKTFQAEMLEGQVISIRQP